MLFSPEDPRNELYSRSGPWRVFVSSVMRDESLAAERHAVVGAADGFPLTCAWAWERDAQAGSYYSVEECIRTAGTSEVLVLILAEDVTDITRAEYEAAHAAGAQILAYLKAGASRTDRATALVSELRERGVTDSFSDPQQLSTKVAGALHSWALRTGRSWMLSEREARRGERDAEPESGYRGATAGTIPVEQIVRGARAAVAEGRADDALESLWRVAAEAVDDGRPWLARRVLDEIEREIPSDAINQRWRGWLANLRGREQSAHRQPHDAIASFEQMRQIGRAIDDADLLSTALQNLAIQATLAGDRKRASALVKESFALKRETGDIRGSVQLMLNLVGAALGRDAVDVAESMLDELEPVIALTRDPLLASTYHGHRGALATSRREWPAAKSSYQRALAAARRAESRPRQVVSLQNLGANANDADDHRAGVRWYRKALVLARELGDRSQEEIQLRGVAVSLSRIGDHQAAADEFLAAAVLAQELSDLGLAATLRADAAACLLNAGRPQDAIDLLQAAVNDPHAAGNDGWHASHLGNLAIVHAALGDHGQAVETYRQAANLAPDPERSVQLLRSGAGEALAHPALAGDGVELLRRELAIRRAREPTEVWAWEAAVMGVLIGRSSRGAEAREFFSRALRVFARRDRRQSFFIRNDRAIAATNAGDDKAAIADLQTCLKIARELDDAVLLQQGHSNLSETHRRAGQLARAREHNQHALDLAERADDRIAIAEGLLQLALIHRDEADFAVAQDLNRRALAIAQELGERQVHANALGALASLEYRAGRHALAARLYRRALRKHGDDRNRAVIEDLAGLILSEAAQGQADDAHVERLAELSGELGWDDQASHELSTAAVLLDSEGSTKRATELMAHALILSVRALFRVVPTPDENDAGNDDPVVRTVAWCGRWLAEDRATNVRLLELVDCVRRDTDAELASAIEHLLRTTVAAVQEAAAKRQHDKK